MHQWEVKLEAEVGFNAQHMGGCVLTGILNYSDTTSATEDSSTAGNTPNSLRIVEEMILPRI